MRIDEGAFLVLSSAAGAFSCRTPPLPRNWNPIDRPHVAILVQSTNDDIFRVYLSNPSSNPDSGETELLIREMESLPLRSIIEVKRDSIDFDYYRKDPHMWTIVGEAQHPFLLEVYSYGADSVLMTTAPGA